MLVDSETKSISIFDQPSYDVYAREKDLMVPSLLLPFLLPFLLPMSSAMCVCAAVCVLPCVCAAVCVLPCVCPDP
jgi:hypothetical protein